MGRCYLNSQDGLGSRRSYTTREELEAVGGVEEDGAADADDPVALSLTLMAR
jgi:hypothetical protein